MGDPAEDRLRDTFAHLPITNLPGRITGAAAAALHHHTEEEEEDTTMKKLTLKDIVLRVLPDPHVSLTPKIRGQLMEAALAAGKETTRGSLEQAVYTLRKVQPGAAKKQRVAAAPKPKAKRKYTRRTESAVSKAPVPGPAETFRELLGKLSACMVEILNENAELRERMQAIAAKALER